MRKLTVVARTDVGMKRDHNEDYFGHDEALGVYVVCDGMGGHASGEVASRMTTDHVVAFVADRAADGAAPLPYAVPGARDVGEALLSNAIQHANDRVFIEGMKDSKLEGMGTTVVAMLEGPDELIVAHVGDSRVYRYRPDEGLSQVTRDHSLLNHKIDQGELTTPEEIKGFKQGNIIVRAIGLRDYVAPEVQSVARRPGDLFLMCSDGLTDLVDDWLIENVLEANFDRLGEAAEALIRMANDRGGKDNITVMFVRVDDEPTAAQKVEEEITDPGRDAFGFHDEVTQPSGIAAVSDSPPEPQAPEPAEALATDPGGIPLITPEMAAAAATGQSIISQSDSTRPGMPVLIVDQEIEPSPVTAPTGPAGRKRAPAPPRRNVATVKVQSGSAGSATGRRRAEAALRDTPGAPPSIIVDLDDSADGSGSDEPSFVIDPSLIK